MYPSPPIPTDVAQQIDFSVASPRAVPLNSAQADSILLSINLEYMSEIVSDSGEDTCISDSDTVSTVSWAASSGDFSTDVSDSHLP